jgi:aryl-alcohol dehydrogenase-like predicted oxidoreductase
MEKRKLGKTDIQISEIAFGSWAIGGWMWGGADDEIKKINQYLSEIAIDTKI